MESQLGSQPVEMGMMFLISDSKEKYAVEGYKTMFREMNQEVWQKFFMEINQKV